MSSFVPIQPTKFPGPFITNTPLVARIDIPISIVTSLFTTPLPVLPAITGYCYDPYSMIFIRNGDRYDTAPGAPRLRWAGATPVLAIDGSAGLLVNASVNGQYAWLFRNANGSIAASDAVGSIGSKGLDIAAAVGNPTVSGPNPGSPLIIYITYYLIPTYSVNTVVS